MTSEIDVMMMGVTVEKLLSFNSDEPSESLEVVMDDQIDLIIYLPVSTDWQQEKCRIVIDPWQQYQVYKSSKDIAGSFGNIQN